MFFSPPYAKLIMAITYVCTELIDQPAVVSSSSSFSPMRSDFLEEMKKKKGKEFVAFRTSVIVLNSRN